MKLDTKKKLVDYFIILAAIGTFMFTTLLCLYAELGLFISVVIGMFMAILSLIQMGIEMIYNMYYQVHKED